MLDLLNDSMNSMVFGAWDPMNVLDGAQDWLKKGGAKFLTVLGIIAIIWGGWYLFRTVIASQQKGRFVGLAIAALVIGAILAVGGMKFLHDVSSGGYKGVKEVGGGVIMPYLQTIFYKIF